LPTRLLRAVLPSLLACTFGVPLAHADIYTWVDGSGTVNISNLAPPEGARVTGVTHENAPKNAAAADAAREAARQYEMQALVERAKELEVQVLSERVRYLEREVEFARSQAPPAPAYAPAYAPAPMAPAVQYAVEPAASVSSGCDPSWMGCGAWWGSGMYPASVVVVGAPGFRRPHPHPYRGGHYSAAQWPVRPPVLVPLLR